MIFEIEGTELDIDTNEDRIRFKLIYSSGYIILRAYNENGQWANVCKVNRVTGIVSVCLGKIREEMFK